MAEVRHFTRAADLRNVSQAAFSRRIKALEQWVGASLIDRATYPLRLTSEGERFLGVAAGLLDQIAEVRSDIAGQPVRNHVRLALPYALARTRLPQWWSQWDPGSQTRCTVEVGHVYDTVSALTAGAVDILIAYQHPAHPIALEASQFERYTLGTERVRPYAARSRVERGLADMPGTPDRPVALLMYTSAVYFSRVIATAIESAAHQLHSTRAAETAMTDVLAGLAAEGHGIAWLPDSTMGDPLLHSLVAVGNGVWDVDIALVAYRSRANARTAAAGVWERLTSAAAQPSRFSR